MRLPQASARFTVARSLSVLIALATAATLDAQAPRRLLLGPATATLREEFSGLTSIRELSNGRALITDRFDNRIALADFAGSSAKTVGHTGNGPGEYLIATELLPLGGDSSLMALSLALRWTIIDGGGSFSTIPPDNPLVAFMNTHSAKGTDASGHLLTAVLPRREPGQLRDSSFLVLINRATMKMDTIGRVDGGPSPKIMTLAQSQARGPALAPYHVYDMSALGVDGWVVVVHASPYRVDWRSPDGRWTNGTAIRDPDVPVTAHEKEVFLARRAARRMPTKVTLAPGVGQGPSRPPPTFEDWPAVIPPFSYQSPLSVLITQHGEVLVERTPTAAQAGPMYDVFDRRGVRLSQLVLPEGKKVLGFGKGTVYVVMTDDDGIQTVSRHAWPVSGAP